MSTLLRVDGIEVGYGDMTAVRDVSLEVPEGETGALIGANGAGKTTTLRAVSGLLPLRRGRIEFEGQRLDGRSSAQIVAPGVAHGPEGRQLFPTMTVRENLELGARTPEARGRVADSLAEVFDLFPRLRERTAQRARPPSGGLRGPRARRRGPPSGRREAVVCVGPRPHGRAAALDAGRAEPRSGSGDGEGDLRGSGPHQRPGHHAPAGPAQRPGV